MSDADQMQTLIQKLRGELSGKTELQAIHALADKLDLQLLRLLSVDIDNDRHAAMSTSAALVFLIKEMAVQLDRAEKV